METFAFLIHPLSIDDVAKKYKIAKKVSPKVVGTILKRKRSFVIAEITGIRSLTGEEAVGWFIVVPILPGQFETLDEDYLVKKITKACRVGEKEGAKIVGLGAYTAMVGNGGKKIAENVNIAVTTGNTYTTTTAIQGTRLAAKLMEIELKNACLTVVGATGSIGSACARMFAPDIGEIRLVGRDMERLAGVAEKVKTLTSANVITSSDISGSLREADIVVTVTGAIDCVIHPEDIKSGAVVCDVARPRDVSKLVSKVRDDVLVIDGGIVKVPGEVDFHFNFGLPEKMAEGCMAETMILALEKRYENYTLGKDISVEKVKEMEKLAAKHGFELAALRRFEKVITPYQIEQVRLKAKANLIPP